MEQPKISIIMAIYNDSQYLADAIDSVLKQTYANWELIIVNDASTDNVEPLIQNFQKKDSRIKYFINAKNNGQTSSLNHGVKLATGEFIGRIDSDDIWEDDSKLQKQVDFFLLHPDHGLVGSWANTIDLKGNKIADLTYPVEDDKIRNYLLIESCFIHSSVLIRKSILDRVNIYDKRYYYAQDYDLWLRIGAVSRLHNIPEYMVNYRIKPSGISQTKYSEQLRETIEIVKSHRYEYKYFLLSITLWHMRPIFPKNLREGISRNLRKFLISNSYL